MSFEVECYPSGKNLRTPAEVLGRGGLFLKTWIDCPVGEEFSLRFQIAEHLPIMETKVKVCFHVPNRGTLVEFTEIRPQDLDALQRYAEGQSASQRRLPRAPLITQVTFGASSSLAYSKDVSAGGMFIETSNPLPLASKLVLRFPIAEDSPVIRTLAEVTYRMPDLGMGVCFIELDPGDRQRLENFVARAKPTPPTSH